MKKIVVFGATGNIGAYFTDYCRKHVDTGYEVIAVGRRKTDFFASVGVTYLSVDITREEDFELLPKDGVYAVVNLAGILPAYYKDFNPLMYIQTNVSGAIRILEYAGVVGADRVVYTQTWAELAGYWGESEVLSSEMPRKLVYSGDHAFYAITKSMVVDTMEFYKQEFGLKNFVFRLPNVYLYHPQKKYYVEGVEKAIGYRLMIDKAMKGEPIEIWGNPDAFKDILYIKDLCQMIVKSLFVDRDGGTYNAGTGIKTTLREQIEGIVQVFSSNPSKHIITEKPSGSTFTSFVMDISKLKLELGYEPEYTYIKYLEDYKKELVEKRFSKLWGEQSLESREGIHENICSNTNVWLSCSC